MSTKSARFQELAEDITEWRKGNGFYTPRSVNAQPDHHTVQLGENDAMLGKLMLVVTEIVEASEELYPDLHRDNLGEELADVAIRVLDILCTCGISVRAVVDKVYVGRDWDLMSMLKYLSRAAEAVRDSNKAVFGDQLGAVLVATDIFCDRYDLKLIEEIEKKMVRNKQRPFKHGRKTSL